MLPSFLSAVDIGSAAEGAAPALLIGLVVPYAFNRWLRPALDKQARLKKYLGLIAQAVAKRSPDDFAAQFDDAGVTWARYARELLELSAADLPDRYGDPLMQEAEDRFIKSGLPALLDT